MHRALSLAAASQDAAAQSGCGGWTRTSDHRIDKPAARRLRVDTIAMRYQASLRVGNQAITIHLRRREAAQRIVDRQGSRDPR
jgi:hypothetical protein